MIFKSHIDAEDVKIKLESIEELPDSKIALLSGIFSNETLLSMDKSHFRKAIKVLIRNSFFFLLNFSDSGTFAWQRKNAGENSEKSQKIKTEVKKRIKTNLKSRKNKCAFER